MPLKYKEGLSSSMLEQNYFYPHLLSELFQKTVLCVLKLAHLLWGTNSDGFGFLPCPSHGDPARIMMVTLGSLETQASQHVALAPLTALLTSFSPSCCLSRLRGSPYRFSCYLSQFLQHLFANLVLHKVIAPQNN